jgi:hypothetical protein
MRNRPALSSPLRRVLKIPTNKIADSAHPSTSSGEPVKLLLVESSCAARPEGPGFVPAFWSERDYTAPIFSEPALPESRLLAEAVARQCCSL